HVAKGSGVSPAMTPAPMLRLEEVGRGRAAMAALSAGVVLPTTALATTTFHGTSLRSRCATFRNPSARASSLGRLDCGDGAARVLLAPTSRGICNAHGHLVFSLSHGSLGLLRGSGP